MWKLALRKAAVGLAAGVDRAFYRTALWRSARSIRRSPAESLPPGARIQALAAMSAHYAEERFFTDPDAFFPRQPRISPVEHPRGRFGPSGQVLDLSWPSEFHPHVEGVAGRYRGYLENQRAHARLFIHGHGHGHGRSAPGRPALVLIHGYLGGRHAMEQRMWPLAWMHALGLDVALFVLPFHGPRMPSGRLRPPFPSSDPRFTIEGFRQAVMDLRSLIQLLRQRGARDVGVMGMSLGGYTTALLATLEVLSFAVPLIPLASIEDFARDGGRLNGTDEERQAQHAALSDIYRVISPLSRPARTPREGLLVMAGESDRITPRYHAERLARHLDAPLVSFHGGHLLQFGRREALRAFRDMLERLGLVAPQRGARVR